MSACALAAAGCGGSARTLLRTPAGARLERRALAGGVLAYAGAWLDGDLVSVELAEAFYLRRRSATDGHLRYETRLGPHSHDLDALAVHRRGQAVFVGGKDRRVRSFVATDAGFVEGSGWQERAAVTSLAVGGDAPSGDARVFVGRADGAVCVRGPNETTGPCRLDHQGRVAALALSPDGETLVSAGWDGRVIWRSSQTLAPLRTLRRPGSANALAFSPDGAKLAIGHSSFPPQRTPELATAEERDGADSTDRGASVEVVAASARGPHHLLWWAPIATAPVTAVAWLGPCALVSAGWDRQVRFWRTPRSIRHRIDGVSPDSKAGAPRGGNTATAPPPAPRLLAAGAVVPGFGGPIRELVPTDDGQAVAVLAWIGDLGDRAIVVLRPENTTTFGD